MSGHPAGMPWGMIDEMRKQREQAIADPRVGDKWESDDLSKIPVVITSIVEADAGGLIRFTYDGCANILGPMSFRSFVRNGFKLISRGPAPEAKPTTDDARLKAESGFDWMTTHIVKDGVDYVLYGVSCKEGGTLSLAVKTDGVPGEMSLAKWLELCKPAKPEAAPERDPHTQPVVGDEWEQATVDRYSVSEIKGDEIRVRDESTGFDYLWSPPFYAGQVEGWRLIAKGDDPAWRPAPTQSDNAEFDRQEAAHQHEIDANPDAFDVDKIEATIRQREAEEAAKNPRVGDEWESPIKNWKLTVRVVTLRHVYGDYSIGGPTVSCGWSREKFIEHINHCTLIRRGEAPVEPPPDPGIKVGDRVIDNDGDRGVVSRVEADGCFIAYDGIPEVWYSFDRLKQFISIIPPVAPDDTGDEPPTPIQQYIPDPAEEQQYRDSKYIRVIRAVGGKTAIEIDVYEVLEAFAVTCPARQHALKKLLCAGIRNKGSVMQDLREAAACVQRAMEMQHQRETKGRE